MAELDNLKFGIEIRKCKECEKIEVVRCYECKYFKQTYYGKTEVALCAHDEWFVDVDSPQVDQQGFCYRGERKNEVNE